MLSKTRVSNTIDTGRLSQAVSRPGIDPRTWVWPAIVKKVTIDADHGVFLDVLLLPDQLPETARYAPIYSGSGFGLYFPIEVDDEIIVMAPHGNPDEGLIAMPRPWSGADKPPAEISGKPADLLLLAKDGATVRVAVQGTGNIVLDPRGTGKVLLGGEAGTSPVSRVGDSIKIPGAGPNLLSLGLQAQLDLRYTILNPASALLDISGTITSGASKVEAK
jgi:hypothetical protein